MNFHIFDSIKDYVYITDIETNKIVYVNWKVLDNFGYQSLEEVKGKYCYKILQGKEKPCEFCTNKYLKEDEIYEWQVYNKLVDKEFLLRDSLLLVDGKKYRIEIGGTKENSDEQRRKRYELHERLINEAFGIASKEGNIEDIINRFLALIGDRVNAERVYIFEFFEEMSANTYEWCKEGVSAEKENLQNVSLKDLSLWIRSFDSHGKVYIRDIEETKDEDPEIYAILKPQGIENLLVKPIYINGKIVGFYGVDNVNQIYLDDIESLMDVCASMMALLLEKRDYYRHMERLSTRDTMTSLFNRKSAEGMIENLLKEHKGAFLILDLDNFKMVNDTFGHYRGDTLLKEVAGKMKEVCRETDIAFRIGGDEFGIYFPTLLDIDIIEDKCKELLEKLNICVSEGDIQVHVSASMGVSLAEEDSHSFLKLYQRADEALYIAKGKGKNRYIIHDEKKKIE